MSMRKSEALNQYWTAIDMMKVAQDLKAEAEEALKNYISEPERYEGRGTLSYVPPSTGSSTSHKKLKDALAKRGVSVTTIVDAYKEATSEYEKKDYVLFTPVKVKK